MKHRNSVGETGRRAFHSITLLIAVLTATASFAAATSPSTMFPVPDAGVVGVTAGSGSLLVTGTNTPFIPLGFGSVGLLYPAQYASALCSKSELPGTNDGKALLAAEAAMTTETDQRLLAMKEHWRANTVRFQISQGALTYEHQNGLSAYTDMVLSAIRQARAMGLVTIVSMQTEVRSCTPTRSNGQLQKLPDQLTEEAWAQIAPALGHDRGVILEVFNEPNTEVECNTGTQVDWTDWATGCGTGADEGMVTVGEYVRTLAPDNVLLFDGDHVAGEFTGYTFPPGMPANSAYTVHPYYYVDGPSDWDIRFGDFQASGNTVLATEWNESSNCPYAQDPNQVLASEFVQSYLPEHNMGLGLFAWDSPGAGTLVNSSDDPVDSNSGCSYFTGATLAYNQFWSDAGGEQPPPEVHVSSVGITDGKVDTVTVALANNGSKGGSAGPQVASSVDLLVVQGGWFPIARFLASMQLTTSTPWTNGSFSLATGSGLAQKQFTARPGDRLMIVVRYEGGGLREIWYPVDERWGER